MRTADLYVHAMLRAKQNALGPLHKMVDRLVGKPRVVHLGTFFGCLTVV